jgi:hypothetical protein
VDTAAAGLFWSEYAAACPEAVRLCPEYTVERFGDSRALADEQAGHRRYWTRTWARRGQEWTEGDEIVFERFRVVWPADLADPG